MQSRLSFAYIEPKVVRQEEGIVWEDDFKTVREIQEEIQSVSIQLQQNLSLLEQAAFTYCEIKYSSDEDLKTVASIGEFRDEQSLMLLTLKSNIQYLQQEIEKQLNVLELKIDQMHALIHTTLVESMKINTSQLKEKSQKVMQLVITMLQ